MIVKDFKCLVLYHPDSENAKLLVFGLGTICSFYYFSPTKMFK